MSIYNVMSGAVPKSTHIKKKACKKTIHKDLSLVVLKMIMIIIAFTIIAALGDLTCVIFLLK